MKVALSGRCLLELDDVLWMVTDKLLVDGKTTWQVHMRDSSSITIREHDMERVWDACFPPPPAPIRRPRGWKPLQEEL